MLNEICKIYFEFINHDESPHFHIIMKLEKKLLLETFSKMRNKKNILKSNNIHEKYQERLETKPILFSKFPLQLPLFMT